MRVSLEWLNDHVDLAGLPPREVGELVTLHIAEVGSIEEPFAGVTVGRVVKVRPHPNADKLRLVTVDRGGGEPVEVVCGAPNVAEGQRICFAPEGAVLPDGRTLERTRIRGVWSPGMVLSERELGLSEEHEGILVLPADAPVGAPAAAVLGGSAALEVENTAITARPDLWGHYGLAREIAAVRGVALRPLDLGDAFPRGKAQVAVEVECPDLCPRYLGWAIGGVEIGPSPDWLQRRLESAGQRPINNVVDLTNYVMLECGQPLHAFDRRQIAQGRIVVRRARPGETVTTLDEVERELPEGACVIADPERTVAVAGVMGCANSEVSPDTKEIVLEVANFAMTSVRATARGLGLRTESAVRFEKGIDPEGVPVAARRFFRLLQQVCPGAKPLGAPSDVRVAPGPPRVIAMEEAFVGRRLGLDLDRGTADAVLGRLGFSTERRAGSLKVTVPSWRLGDVELKEDLVEEVGRIHGYGRIAPVPLHGRLDPVPLEAEREARGRIRRALSVECGLSEAFLYPFTTAEACGKAGIEPGSLRLANAEQPGLDLMTPSLLPRLLAAVADNLKYRREVGLYAVQPVFERRDEGLPRENERVTLVLARLGERSPVFAVKGAVEACLEALAVAGARIDQQEGPPWLHAGRCARVGRGKQDFGWFGELHPGVARAFDIDAAAAVADLDLDALRRARGRGGKVQPISRFPTVPFDVAVLADRRTPAAEIEAVLRRADDLVREVRLFDVYEGRNLPEGKRSLAFCVVFGALDRTLGTDDVERLRAAVQGAIERKGWGLRTG